MIPLANRERMRLSRLTPSRKSCFDPYTPVYHALGRPRLTTR
jgi:hypothetical protein